MVAISRMKTTAPENTRLVEAIAPPSEAGFLNALVEAYEGMAVMRTVDRRLGRFKYWVPEGQIDLLKSVFDDFIRRGWMLRYEVVEPWWETAAKTDVPPHLTSPIGGGELDRGRSK